MVYSHITCRCRHIEYIYLLDTNAAPVESPAATMALPRSVYQTTSLALAKVQQAVRRGRASASSLPSELASILFSPAFPKLCSAVARAGLDTSLGAPWEVGTALDGRFDKLRGQATPGSSSRLRQYHTRSLIIERIFPVATCATPAPTTQVCPEPYCPWTSDVYLAVVLSRSLAIPTTSVALLKKPLARMAMKGLSADSTPGCLTRVTSETNSIGCDSNTSLDQRYASGA